MLQRAGLISQGREAQWRRCRLEAAPLKDAAAWIEHYRRYWEESFGRGIPADKVDAIFEPFVQVEEGLTRTTEGVGLGLAISRSFARDMNGDLSVETAVGKGSVFTLSLPRAEDLPGDKPSS